MTTIETDVLGTEEAARLCGYSDKYPWRFLRDVRAGLIPGTKIGRTYRFYRPDLIALIRGNYFTEVNIAGNKSWRSAKRKTVLTTIRDSRSAESEFKSRLNAHRKQKPSSMKTNAAMR